MRNKHQKSSHDGGEKKEKKKDMDKDGGLFKGLFCVLLASLLGFIHMKHVENLFENDKHFSHLSNIERELSFRTESGLYYYYFKSLVVDRDLNPLNNTGSDSLLQLVNTVFLNDNRTEHPDTINSLQRFNLYPELTLAIFYRVFNYFGLIKKNCWKVNRGEEMPPVESCEGLLEPIYFYSKSVFVLHGLLVFLLFILCYKVNNKSISSGLIGCLCYFYNHGEATRVMWVPALRESFSFPFHLLQILSLISLIRSSTNQTSRRLFFIVSTLLYLLPWQFAQFSLATQLISIFAVYSLGFLDRDKFVEIVRLKTLTLTLCFLLMFANRMLFSSLYASLLFSSWLLIFLEGRLLTFLKNNRSFLRVIVNSIIRLAALFGFMYFFKNVILDTLLNQQDDSHIWDILKSKVNPVYHTFDTRLYTCAKEFDFIEISTIYKLTTTLLIPVCLLNVLFIGLIMAKKLILGEAKTNEDAIVIYNILQMTAYGSMAALIMRLKLFWTPYLCLVASFVATKAKDKEYLSYFNVKKQIPSQNRYIILVLLVAVMSYQGVNNLRDQYKVVGEYSSFDMELMMKWIEKNTGIDDAFVGPMSSMANVKLSTNRPIVNHPHYEDMALRNRTKYIYSYMYGYLSPKHLYKLVKFDLKAAYVLVEEHFCRHTPPGKPECGLTTLAHMFLGANRTSETRACQAMLDETDLARNYFARVFKRGNLNLFKVIQ